jgi:hypothetical protein
MEKKNTPQQQKSEYSEFLSEHKFLAERVEMDIDIYPGDDVLKTFQKIAKTIDAERYFTIYGCQSCVRDLIKFVYDNQK